MMIHKTGDWRAALLILVSWIIMAALILGIAAVALSALQSFVGLVNFPALALLVAMVGGSIAFITFRTNALEKKQTRARMLAFIIQMGHDTHRNIQRPLAPGFVGNIDDPYLVAPETLRQRNDGLEEFSKALNSLDVKEMPSVGSMEGLVKLRATLKGIFEMTKTAKDGSDAVDFEYSAVKLITTLNALEKERDALYPIYQIGPFQFQSPVERR